MLLVIRIYAHLGRQAAMILAPPTPRLFEARLRLVMAPISSIALARATTGHSMLLQAAQQS
jgi:hypothetical protein